jgi:D-3-phosphoglycerate dehydrogenase
MKIAVLDDYQDAVRGLRAFELLAVHEVTVFTEPVGVEELEPFEALVLIRERTSLGAEDLARLPNLRLIAQTGRVGGHVDVAAAAARGISVAEGIGSPVAPAELTWALVLAAARRLPQYVEHLRFGEWQQNGLGLGHVLRGRTLGIYGYGKIGSIVASYGRAFGMEVLVRTGEQSRLAAREAGDALAGSADELFERADVLSLHLRLTGETRGIVGAEQLARMKPSSLLVNTSRAGLLEPGALLEALRAGRPGFAALDVFDEEPTTGDPLLALPNVVATPHIGYVEQDGYELYFESAFRNVLDFAA